MKKTVLMFILVLFAIGATTAQTDFEWEKRMVNWKATIKILEDKETVVFVPLDKPNSRYISANLPSEYKIDGLAATVTGWIGKIPPNFRMIGTPFKLEKITIRKADKRKYKLSKSAYCFKK
jgi:hypothetical protein